MDFNGLRLEYALKGNSNYISWKDKMEALLEDTGLKEFIDKDVPKPDVANAANLDAWKNKVAKVRRICWREYETTLSQASMGNSHHMQCGRL
jgi:hypothetical protein